MAREMKDSGIAWIGKIPKEWNTSQLKHVIKWKSVKNHGDAQVLSLYRDYGIVPKDSRDDNHNVTSLDTSGYKYVESGDLVVNKMKAWQGSIAVSNYDGIVSPAYHVCEIISPQINKMYLHYLLRNLAYLPEYMRLSTGMRVGQWDLGYDDFINIPIIIPDIHEQERIVRYINIACTRIDSVIEQTRASIEEYKKLKQSVITQAVTKGIRTGQMMKDSGVPWIGNIPLNWSRDKVFRIFQTIGSGTTPKSDNSDYYDGNIHWIQSGDINGGFLTNTKISITDEAINTFSALKIYEAPFIIMAMYGGSIGNLSISRIDGCVNQACCVMQNGKQDIRYSFYALKVAKDYLVWKAVGGGQPNISQDTIKQLWLPMPPNEEQAEIADYLDEKITEMEYLIVKKEQLLSYVENYKNSLIFEYITGKKEVV